MNDLAAATIVAKSHLPYARVLAESFRGHHPDVPFLVLFADDADGYFDPSAEPFELVTLEHLGIPGLRRMLFRYAKQELSYAVTPYFISTLLNHSFRRVAFFKPYAYDRLEDGELIPYAARQAYRRLTDDEAEAFGDPWLPLPRNTFTQHFMVDDRRRRGAVARTLKVWRNHRDRGWMPAMRACCWPPGGGSPTHYTRLSCTSCRGPKPLSSNARRHVHARELCRGCCTEL